MREFKDGTVRLAGMIMPAPDGLLTPEAATAWLREWGGDYARAIQLTNLLQETDCADSEERNAIGMLLAEFSWVLDAIGHVIATGETLRLEVESDPRELRGRCVDMAHLIGARWHGALGPHEAVYDDLAQRIAVLLAETQEVA